MLQDKDIHALEQKYNCIIPERRIKTWEVQMKLLDVFDAICKKYQLQYFFFWGALLGAVRHQGFIPWDDDIDIVMPREDYDRFGELAPQEIIKPYFLLTSDTAGDSFYYHMKLVDESTTYIIQPTIDWVTHHQGITLDIVPLDGVPENHMARVIQQTKQLLDNRLTWTRFQNPKFLSAKGKLLRVLGKLYCCNLSNKRCIERTEKIKSKYKWNESKYVADGAHFNIFRKEWFEDTAYLVFEDRKVPAPIGYDMVLKKIYGNYMELPNPKQRMISEREASGAIIDPNVAFADYSEIVREKKIHGKKRWIREFHNYEI